MADGTPGSDEPAEGRELAQLVRGCLVVMLIGALPVIAFVLLWWFGRAAPPE